MVQPLAELQIREGIEDNFRDHFSYFSTKTYVVTPHKNRLDKTVLMMGHKICLYIEIWQIIPKISLLPLLSGALMSLVFLMRL